MRVGGWCTWPSDKKAFNTVLEDFGILFRIFTLSTFNYFFSYSLCLSLFLYLSVTSPHRVLVWLHVCVCVCKYSAVLPSVHMCDRTQLLKFFSPSSMWVEGWVLDCWSVRLSNTNTHRTISLASTQHLYFSLNVMYPSSLWNKIILAALLLILWPTLILGDFLPLYIP